jgi:hypothetical protein
MCLMSFDRGTAQVTNAANGVLGWLLPTRFRVAPEVTLTIQGRNNALPCLGFWEV